MTSPILIYGATGYTGELIARHAAARGVPAILAGRDTAKVKQLAQELALPWRVFELDDPLVMSAALAGVCGVLHCAGPYSRTYRPMVEACMDRRLHYLDLTGELQQHEAMSALNGAAKDAGIMLLPSVGFDVVPSDSLAVHLRNRHPGATHLALAFFAEGGWSRGTMLSSVEAAGRAGWVRREGRLVAVPPGWRTRVVDFGERQATAVTIPWGDVASAYRSTGIPNIETYIALPAVARLMLRSMRGLGGALGSRAGQRVLKSLVGRMSAGPGQRALETGYALLWGEVRDAAGSVVTGRMKTPHPYRHTADAAVAIAERVIAGDVRPGYQTPASAYGPDFVLSLPGVTRWDG